MKIVSLVVDLTGSRNCLVNGVDTYDPRAVHEFDEKIFNRQLTPDQQWHVLCETRKLLSRMEDVYTRGAEARGESKPRILGAR